MSASRRTDIPALYSRWFLRRLEAGYCEWIHPFTGKLQRVSLRPEDSLALVFWTRNPEPLFPALEALRRAGHVVIFHVTITGYPKALESHGPPLERSVARIHELATRIGPEAIHWRYDPIVIGSLTPTEFHLENFARIAREIRGSTSSATISFVDFYGKTKTNLERVAAAMGASFEDPAPPHRRELALRLRDLAAASGLGLRACCEDGIVGAGIEKAHCIDLDLVRSLRGSDPIIEDLPRRPTREECGCSESVDIGAYDTCPLGCAYCYATRSRDTALARLRGHDPEDTVLWRPRRP